MPRVTRKTVAESSASPARMSPRATTKASTTSSRSSRSTTVSPSTASPRSARSRASKSPGGDDQPDVDVGTPKTTTRGRQSKPAGDASTVGDVTPVGRGRSNAKAVAKTEETETKASGRSQSRTRSAKIETKEPTEETVSTPSRSRRTKPEEDKEKSVEETGRVSRSKLKEKQDEEKATPGRAGSRSRSSNKDQPAETSGANSRSRRGGKSSDSTKEDTAENNETKVRSRSRTKTEETKSPEIEVEPSQGRGRGRAQKSPTNESVRLGRSSSRNRTSKTQSEEFSEPGEVKEEVSKAKSKPNGSARAASKRRGADKAAAEESTEKSDQTPGRRSGRGRKVETSPSTPSKRRRVQAKSDTPEKDKDADPADEQVEEREEEIVKTDDKKFMDDAVEKMEVTEENENHENDENKTDALNESVEVKSSVVSAETKQKERGTENNDKIEENNEIEMGNNDEEAFPVKGDSGLGTEDQPKQKSVSDVEEKSEVRSVSVIESKPGEILMTGIEDKSEEKPVTTTESIKSDTTSQTEMEETKITTEERETKSVSELEEVSKSSMEEEEDNKSPGTEKVVNKLEPTTTEEKSKPMANDSMATEDRVEESETPATNEIANEIESTAKEVKDESKLADLEDVGESCQKVEASEEPANIQDKEKDEFMEVEETDQQEVLLSQNSSSWGRREKRKLDVDDSFEESNSKRVCIDEEIVQTVPEQEQKEPVSQVTEPLPQVTEPVSQVTEPVSQVTEPVSQVTEPVSQVTEPVSQVTEPVSQVTEPVSQVTEPVSQVTESVSQLTESVSHPVSDVPQAVEKQSTQVEESVTHVMQQPAIEAISDVSSAEDETSMTCSVDVQNGLASQPVGSKDTLQMSSIKEANTFSTVEDISQEADPVLSADGEPASADAIQEAPALANREVMPEGETDIGGQGTAEPNQEPILGMDGGKMEATSEELSTSQNSSQQKVESTRLQPCELVSKSTNQEASLMEKKSTDDKSQKQEEEEDLTASYVVVSMDEVPCPDSLEVKEALSTLHNHKDKGQDQPKEQESMEVDQEQNQTMDTSEAPLKYDAEKCPESNTKSSDTTLPVSLESVKSETNTVKQVRDFEPSKDIFHRSYAHNPFLKTPVPETDTFSVVSYNILAECHRQRGDYSYTEEKFLEQEYRHQLLLRELQYLDADVVCLQEVNPQYYKMLLEPALLRCGYQGSFMKRTWDVQDEGEATFFKTSRFSMESTKGFSLAELAKKNISETGLDADVQAAVEEYLDRADVVNVSRLRCKQTEKLLTVGNIHVVWDQLRSPDIQSIQIASAVKEVVSQAGSDSCPHILCGDFNSVPSSVGYQLAQDGYLSDSNIATLQGVENLKLQSGSKALINHLWGAFQHTSSNLTSAYNICQGEEPEITTFTRHMLECVDYLFFGNVGLGVTSVLRVVDRSVIEDSNGLPTQEIPSDHLSLKANFFFK